MGSAEQTMLLGRVDADLCAGGRRDLKQKVGGLRVAAVTSSGAARGVLEDSSPAVILLEEACVEPESEEPRRKMPRLNAVVSSLAMHAPVVVIGPAERRGGLAALVAAGASDYVPRHANCM